MEHGPQGRHTRSAADEDGLRARLAQAELAVGPDDLQLVADVHALLQVAREEAARVDLDDELQPVHLARRVRHRERARGRSAGNADVNVLAGTEGDLSGL